jgi:hypothetical protein
MPPPTASDVSLQACLTCRNVRMTTAVAFRRNVGMIVFRRRYTIRGNLCKSCIKKFFWEFEWKNLLFGPWGIISLIVTPVYLIWNFFTYLGAMSKLRGTPE